MTPDRDTDVFSVRRAAVASAAVAAFLLILQPLGIRIDSFAEGLVVLGVAPVNFIVMLAAHEVFRGRGPFRTLLTFGAIAGANVAYFIFWSSEAMFMPTLFKVGLVVLLAAGAIGFWTRYRSLEEEVVDLRARPAPSNETLVQLRGEGENEIFQAPPSHLLYVEAQGNYAEIASRQNDAIQKTLLRSTLAAVETQSDGALTRCHRSYLVNLAQARRLVSDRQGMRLELADGSVVPVSRSYRAAIKSALTA